MAEQEIGDGYSRLDVRDSGPRGWICDGSADKRTGFCKATRAKRTRATWCGCDGLGARTREEDEGRPYQRREKSLFETINDGLLQLNDAVGDGRRNEERDVERVDRSLARLDFRPREKQEQPDSYISRGLDTAIKLFQKAHNLKVDGWLAPGGETEEALNSQLALKAEEQKPTPPSTTTIKKDPEPAAAPASKSNPDNDPERDATGQRIRERQSSSRDQMMRRSPENQKLIDIGIKTYQKKKEQGQDLASDMLKNYYLFPVDKAENDVTSKKQQIPYVIPAEAIKKVPEYNEARDKNNWRFIEAMRDGVVDKKVPSAMRDQILSLPDGHKIDLKNSKTQQDDYWDAAIKRNNFKVIKGDDFQSAVGAANLKSTGALTAERHGSRIKVQGKVTHDLRDVYDFNDDTLLDQIMLKSYRKAADQGLAKPFPVKSQATQKLEAEFELRDGRLIHRSIQFHDIP